MWFCNHYTCTRVTGRRPLVGPGRAAADECPECGADISPTDSDDLTIVVEEEGTRFVVVPGHANVELEVVVERAPGYEIVEKDGLAGIVADLSDPRDGDDV